MDNELPTHIYNRMPNSDLAVGLSAMARMIAQRRTVPCSEAIALLTVAACRLKGYPQPGKNNEKGAKP